MVMERRKYHANKLHRDPAGTAVFAVDAHAPTCFSGNHNLKRQTERWATPLPKVSEDMPLCALPFLSDNVFKSIGIIIDWY